MGTLSLAITPRLKGGFVKRTAVIRLGVCLAVAISGVLWYERTKTSPDRAVVSAILQARNDSPADRTLAQWTEKVKQNPEDHGAWAQLGDALMQRARETASSAYYSQAEAAFQKVLSLDPENSSAVVGLSWVYGSRHEFEQSTAWAHKALALDPQNPRAYGLLGDAAVEMGEYEQAFEHYQKMLDLRPDLSSYSRSAHLLFLTGDTRKAMWLMRRAIAAGGPYAENTAWCRAQHALMLLATGAVLPAEQEIQAAFQQVPNNYHVLAAMAKVKAARKEYPAAIDYYRKATAITPQPDAMIALGDLYLLAGQREEAEKQYALVEAILKPSRTNGVKTDIQRARFYADHDRNLEEALREAEAVSAKHKNVFVWDTLAWCYYKKGRYQEARKAIEQAMKLRTPEASFLFHAGMIHAKLGARPDAQKYLYQALSLNPNFHPVDAVVAADTLKQLGSTPANM